MKLDYIYKHPTRVMAWYLFILLFVPGIIFSYSNISVGGLLVLLCLGVFRTYTIIREMQYTAVFSTEVAKKYLWIDNISMLAGLAIYYGAELYFYLGTRNGTNFIELIFVFGCFVPSFMRIELLNKNMKKCILESSVDDLLRDYINELENIDGLIVKEAKSFPDNPNAFYVTADMGKGIQLIIEKDHGDIEAWLYHDGLFHKSLVPVIFAIESMKEAERNSRQTVTFQSKEAALQYLLANYAVLQQILIQKRVRDFASTWNNGIGNKIGRIRK